MTNLFLVEMHKTALLAVLCLIGSLFGQQKGGLTPLLLCFCYDIIENMPRQPRKIEVGGVYHIINRGVEKRKIYLKNQDYSRFILGLEFFNAREFIDLWDLVAAKGGSDPPLDRITQQCLFVRFLQLMLRLRQISTVEHLTQPLYRQLLSWILYLQATGPMLRLNYGTTSALSKPTRVS